MDFAKRYTYKLTGGKQNPCLIRRSLVEKIATIDGWLKMTGCRIVECKQVHTNDKKSNNPLPHNTEKSVALVYYTQGLKLEGQVFFFFILCTIEVCIFWTTVNVHRRGTCAPYT